MKRIFILIFILLFPFINYASDWKFIEKLPSYVSVLTCPSADCCYSLIYDSSVPSIELFKSSDHGNSWFSVYKRTPIRTPRRACSPLPDHFYILQWDKSEMLKSIDGGITFKEIVPEPEKIMLDLIMYNENIGVAQIHTSEYIYVTYDGWETHQERKFQKPDGFNGYYYGGTLAFRNQENIQIRFTNQELTGTFLANYNLNTDTIAELFEFKPDSVGLRRPDLHKIIYLNDTLGFIAASRYLNLGDRSQEIVFRTTDGGHNWHKSLDTGYTKPQWEWGLYDIDFYDERNGMAVGKRGTIFFTNNGGGSWVHSEWHGDIVLS